MKTKFKKASKRSLMKDQKIFRKYKFDEVKESPDDPRDYTMEQALQTSIACFSLDNESEANETLSETFPDEYESEKLPILNQGSVGSCVAHALSSALTAGEKANNFKANDYSRGYIYGNRKSTDYQGDGMYIRQALKQLNHCGDVFYSDFPYNKKYEEIKKLIEPRKTELADLALPHAIEAYYRCYTIDEIKKSIMINGCAIVSVTCYSDFGRDLHQTKTHINNGYHCMIIVGWTKDNKWIVQNSWSSFWGYKGKLLMDFDYPINECWGVLINSSNVKDNIKEKAIVRFFAFIKSIFKVIKIWITDIFKKKRKKG